MKLFIYTAYNNYTLFLVFLFLNSFIHKVHKIYLHRYVNQVYFTPNIPKQLNEI